MSSAQKEQVTWEAAVRRDVRGRFIVQRAATTRGLDIGLTSGHDGRGKRGDTSLLMASLHTNQANLSHRVRGLPAERELGACRPLAADLRQPHGGQTRSICAEMEAETRGTAGARVAGCQWDQGRPCVRSPEGWGWGPPHMCVHANRRTYIICVWVTRTGCGAWRGPR